MLVSTTENIGQDYQVIGAVFGVMTQSRNILSDVGAEMKSVVGGEVRAYSKMLARARAEVVDRMCEEARERGGDAVVMMRFDTSQVSSGMQAVMAYGTAVKLK